MTITPAGRYTVACALLLCGCGGTEPSLTQASHVWVSPGIGGAVPGTTVQAAIDKAWIRWARQQKRS